MAKNAMIVAAKMDRIRADLETCTQAMEIMRPIVSDSTLLKKFDNSYSANVVSCLQDILRDHAMMTLCRMWDEDKDAQSIPSARFTLPKKDPAKASHGKYDQVVRLIDRVRTSSRLKRLRNFRDKYLGHPLERSRLEKKAGTIITSPELDRIFVLYRQTGVIVEALAAVAADTAFDHAESREFKVRCSNAFWGSFVDRPQ